MDSKKVVIINGPGGAGKDTFCSLCSKMKRTKNISSVDKIKEVAKELGWDGNKDDKGRRLLSDLKRVSIEYNDGPLQYINNQISNFLSNNEEELLFIHIREPEEIEKIKARFDCQTLFIIRENKRIFGNYSDDNAKNYRYDYYIDNNGAISELEVKARKFIVLLFGKELG